MYLLQNIMIGREERGERRVKEWRGSGRKWKKGGEGKGSEGERDKLIGLKIKLERFFPDYTHTQSKFLNRIRMAAEDTTSTTRRTWEVTGISAGSLCSTKKKMTISLIRNPSLKSVRKLIEWHILYITDQTTACDTDSNHNYLDQGHKLNGGEKQRNMKELLQVKIW